VTHRRVNSHKAEKHPIEDGFVKSSLRHGARILRNQVYFEVRFSDEGRGAVRHPALVPGRVSPAPFYEAAIEDL